MGGGREGGEGRGGEGRGGIMAHHMRFENMYTCEVRGSGKVTQPHTYTQAHIYTHTHIHTSTHTHTHTHTHNFVQKRLPLHSTRGGGPPLT